MNSIWYYEWIAKEDPYTNGIVFPFRTKQEATKHADKYHEHEECNIEEALFNEVIDLYTGE